ncbi:DUF3313 domain-containing protein [Dickeya oryzae]|uniref:DUF3313 domain-containing protein n=1 Tax=Dickeya oryzae TaxID=1240404 RepID=A0AB39IVF2_9GAMM|nr:DUF3313 domain-containing protein [Dickeya oryzae]MBP2856378.1 DUF3313 domain-containing protein [Dickeya oryzae]MCA6990069.1 DUF3313 domain-containing protein [Dickeya oryzae]
MKMLRQVSGVMVISIALLLAGCAGNQPVRYSGIDSAAKLSANTDDNAERMPWRYSPQVDWRKYDNIIIDPVKIYQGSDGQFDDIAQVDRQALATHMQDAFSKALSTRFKTVGTPATGTLRLKLTLTGADTTPQVVGTVTKFDLAGGPYNIVQSVRGGRGLMSGSVDYAVEIYDASSHELLKAYVAHQYPNAMNISASIGSLSAAEVGIEKGAEELAEMLQ